MSDERYVIHSMTDLLVQYATYIEKTEREESVSVVNGKIQKGALGTREIRMMR